MIDNNWRNTRNREDGTARYHGGLCAMTYSESTGYVTAPPVRGWNEIRINRKLRHVGKMKRQLCRIVTFSTNPPF
jgi:hypothetical protein